MEWTDKKILIFGKGKSGRAAYRRLESLGATPVFYDDNDFEGEERQCSFLQAEDTDWDTVILSPAVKPDHPLLAALARRGVPTISEIDFGWMINPCKTVAVTGTNGKTTTVRQIEKLLSDSGVAALAVGNIGVPFCGVERPLDVAVVEISSFQCHQSALFTPTVAAITNVEPDHIEWHGDLHAYREAKLKLLRMAQSYALNADDPDLPRIAGKPCYPYSLVDTASTAFVEGRTVKVRDAGRVYEVAKVEDLPLRGNHNLYNVLCALALTVAVVGYRATFTDSVLTFRGERMRVERLTDRRPYVYNDSKGTNTAATIAAMRQMVGDTVLLVGGWDKGEDFTRLFMQLPRGVSIVAFGAAGVRIYREALLSGFREVAYAATVADAVRLAFRQDKDNILFSPACSSFDAYSSYVERGLDFEKEVRRYV